MINEQKATMIVEHVSYNQIEGSYDSSIFTQEKHTSLDKAYEGKKSIVDYVFTDGYAQKGRAMSASLWKTWILPMRWRSTQSCPRASISPHLWATILPTGPSPSKRVR